MLAWSGLCPTTPGRVVIQRGLRRAGEGQRPCEPVEFGDDRGVAGAAGGEGEAEAGSVAVGAGQAVVDVDAVVTDTERMECVSLCGEILLLC